MAQIAQNEDGGWGGDRGICVERRRNGIGTGNCAGRIGPRPPLPGCGMAGCWIVWNGSSLGRTPIGFYFAKLWYFERLYPIIFSVAALGRAVELVRETTSKSGLEPKILFYHSLSD